jgi:hypothetical protein
LASFQVTTEALKKFKLAHRDRLEPQCRMPDYAASGVASVVITAFSIILFGNQIEYASTSPAMVAEMDRLLEDYNYADTARILNEKGFKTGDGLPSTSIAVGLFEKLMGAQAASTVFGDAECLPSQRSLDRAAFP